MDPYKTPFDDPGFSGNGEDASSASSSATGAFGTVPAAAAKPTEEDLLRSLMRQSDAPGEAAPSAVPAVSAPGEFTQLLTALNASPPAAAASSVPASPAKQGSDLASIFKQVSFEKTAVPELAGEQPVQPAAKSVSGPGSFTQMFQAMQARSQPVAAAPDATQDSGPGSFTQMFSALKEAGPARNETQPPAPVAPQPAVPVLAAPVFSATAPASSQKPGSFTQMFSSLNPATSSQPAAPQEDPLKSLKAEPVPASNFQFTSPAHPPEPSAQGGFTQLLQALNQETTQRKPAEPPLAASPVADLTPMAGGGFTQLLRTLIAEPASPTEAPPVLPPARPTVAPPASSGPSEFTRVISGSALRDLQGAGAAPAAAAPVGQPVFAPPQLPKMPAAPAAAPHFAPPPFAFPQPPAIAAPVPEASKLQKYLPLILVLNLFVLVVIVLILFFALHHK